MNSVNKIMKVGTKILTKNNPLKCRPVSSSNMASWSSGIKKNVPIRAYAYGAAGTGLVGAGVTLMYAKDHPEFREKLKTYSKGPDNVIQFLWQEEHTFKEYLNKFTDKKNDK